MIPLMKTTFYDEFRTRKALAEFIMVSDHLTMGVQCREFERAFARKQGCGHAVLFSSGGSANLALLQALRNLDRLQIHDKIGFSALTWSTNVMPIIQLGFEPVPIDVEPASLNSTSTLLIDRLATTPLQALFITNALGFAGDLDKIKAICDERNILFLEDNCEALGAELHAGKTGAFGLASTFSFFVAHHMSTIEGGMICSNDEEVAEMCRVVRANGWDRNLNAVQQAKWRRKFSVKSEFDAKYTFYDLGFNMRPTEITGFLGTCQLQFLDDNIKIRASNHLRLESVMRGNPDFIALNHDNLKVLSPFAFPVICATPECKEEYLSQFSGAGIEVRPIIAGNMQNQPFYRKYVSTRYELSGTDFIHGNGFYCGNYPGLTESDLEVISSCLLKL